MTRIRGYSGLQIGLHWLIAVLLVVNWFLGDGMGKAWRARMEAGTTGIEGNTWHVWIGGAILLLVVVRIVARLVQGAPEAPQDDPAWQQSAGIWSHRLLYLLMLAVPVLGALAWYWGIRWAGEAHEIAVNVLLAVVALHTAAALYHQYVKRDGLLKRMMRPEA